MNGLMMNRIDSIIKDERKIFDKSLMKRLSLTNFFIQIKLTKNRNNIAIKYETESPEAEKQLVNIKDDIKKSSEDETMMFLNSFGFPIAQRLELNIVPIPYRITPGINIEKYSVDGKNSSVENNKTACLEKTINNNDGGIVKNTLYLNTNPIK